MEHQGREDYEERRAARVNRLRARATKRAAEGSAKIEGARRTADMIPFGQPILVGHHSERRHRKDIERIDAGFSRGFQKLKEAERLERRAETAEANRAISSDDPNAVERIREKLANLQRQRETMKLANKLIRAAKGDKGKAIASLMAEMQLKPETAAALLEPDCFGNVGFPDFKLRNIGSEIRRLEQRLKALEANAAVQATTEDVQIGEVTIREQNNRTQMVFPGKPSEEVRKLLKSHGFRWAPSEGAWHRLSSPQARRAAETIARHV